MSFYDTTRESLIVVARPRHTAEITTLPDHVGIPTHSGQSTQGFVVAFEYSLLENGVDVSRNSMKLNSANFHLSALEAQGRRACFVVVEDEEPPILSDRSCFEALITPLEQPIQLLWLSPDATSHGTGVARTAYAENEELRLTIMHVAPALMSSDPALGPSRRLRNIFDRTFNSHEPYKEREYRVNEAGTVLIPRLRHSQSFNYAVGPRTGDSHDELQQILFSDKSRSFAMSTRDSCMNAWPGNWPWFPQLTSRSDVFADEEVEIETLGLGL